MTKIVENRALKGLTCDQCNTGEIDDQKHIISCKILENNKISTVKYSDLFSKNINTVKKAITEYEKSWTEMCQKRSEEV